ncbi:class I SAM-dependent methyltransferase [Nitratireductor thuwali]|uniref:Malonyl-[acyl-carrier protein] O-methyltransferase n=1 Tax=Nitratireductor thuwali TaxID=2267699 RepID=A0ABY5MK08_9HYPH|nr:Malonyl-[acyl-carrier protein] O-methyltransferase [Nitratireductor thuwali]
MTGEETTLLANYGLKDEIRDYWSGRAATFDDSPSHRIDEEYGMPEWHRLIRQACGLEPFGNLAGHQVLDIACGTGEVSRMLCGLGATVTGIDFSETMLARARRKLVGQAWRGLLCDAEALALLPDAHFDLVVTRHLVWTLTDPMAAFTEWRRVLKPGGRILIVDGNWVAPKKSILQRVRNGLANLLEPAEEPDRIDRERHFAILSRVAYAGGLTPRKLEQDLRRAGFTECRLLSVHRLYGRGMRNASLAQRLRLTGAHRFAFVAS